MTFTHPTNRSVLACVREYEGEVPLCVANLSRHAQAAEIELSRGKFQIYRKLVATSRRQIQLHAF